jgi:alpha-L-rhamnosidase
LKVLGSDGKIAEQSFWFETGAMNPSIEAWSGAQWIGGDDEGVNFFSHCLSIYKLNFGIQLDENSKSNKAAFLFGANDSRLANKNLNIMDVESRKNESYVALELDLTELNTSGDSGLNIYRAGYAA